MNQQPMHQQQRIPSGLNILFSIWLIVSPFLLGFAAMSGTAMWDAIIVGVIVLILAIIREASPEGATWLSWVNAILGIWLVISPFILGTSFMAAVLWDDIIVGVAFFVFGLWSALATRRAMA